MKARRKVILRRIGLALLGLLLGVNVYVLNARSVGGNRLPMPLGFGAAVVQSGSMEPTYCKGDLLFIKPAAQYAVGEIVVYQSGGSLVVHRILSLDGSTVITQGDANNAPDAPFDVSCIKGRVVGRIPAIGLAIDFFKTPLGILLLLGLAILLVELSFRRAKNRPAPPPDRPASEADLLRAEIEALKKELDKKE